MTEKTKKKSIKKWIFMCTIKAYSTSELVKLKNCGKSILERISLLFLFSHFLSLHSLSLLSTSQNMKAL